MSVIKSKGTYTIVQDTYVISINYTYYYDAGDYETPEDEELEITSVYLDEADITDFYWDYLLDDDRLDSACLLYTSPSPRDRQKSRMPSSA